MTVSPSVAALVATSLFGQLIDALGRLMAFFYSIIPNYGVSIILLTITVRLLLFPLTAKQVRSMKRMSQLQPEIKRLQAKYRDDRPKMNEELLKFYKENQINPAAGCLPLLLQMPVFFALFRVLRHPTDHIPQSSELFAAFCPGGPVNCDPIGLKFMWMDLSVQARQGPEGGFTSFTQALPYYVLIVLVVLTGMYQGRMMQARQPTDNPSPQAAQMQMIAKILPIFMGFISLGMPAGIVLYFLVGNLWQIGQQALIANREVKLPAVKIVDRDDDVVVEVEEARPAGSGAALVAETSTPAQTAKPAPKAQNQRPAARKPGAGAGGSRPPKPQTAKAATPETTAADDGVPDGDSPSTTADGEDVDAATATRPAAARPTFPWRRAEPTASSSTETPAPSPTAPSSKGSSPSSKGSSDEPAAARPAARSPFPWRKASQDATGNGRAATGRETNGRAGRGGAATGKGGSATGSGSAKSGSGGAKSGGATPTSGRVTPKGGNAGKPKKRR